LRSSGLPGLPQHPAAIRDFPSGGPAMRGWVDVVLHHHPVLTARCNSHRPIAYDTNCSAEPSAARISRCGLTNPSVTSITIDSLPRFLSNTRLKRGRPFRQGNQIMRASHDAEKRAVAGAALRWVRTGMRLGLGSGSTSHCFIELLGERVRRGEVHVEGHRRLSIE
jgi:hypothetical protein